MLILESRLRPFGLLIEPAARSLPVTELPLDHLRKLFHREQLLVLRGFETFKTAEEFSTYCQRWGEVAHWPFGKVLELVECPNAEDHIFASSYVPLHWDGMYRALVPEYQIFHCVRAPGPGQGGRTTFSHTALALQTSSPDQRSRWEQVTGSYTRKMEFYHSRVTSPLIVTHPHKKHPIIRYNEPPSAEAGAFLNPPELKFRGLDSEGLAAFHRSLQKALYDPGNFYAHEWRAGDVVIADNFTLLHGREAFESRAPRHLQRVHVLSDPPFSNPNLESYR